MRKHDWEGSDFINTVAQTKKLKFSQHLPILIDKTLSPEYISSDSSASEEPYVKEELTNISQEDEAIVIKYILDVMRTHDLITEEEYQTVLYKKYFRLY